jgi:dCTP deaminase
MSAAAPESSSSSAATDLSGAVLSRSRILDEIKAGRITITPPPADENIGPASVDLHLSPEFRFYKHGTGVVTVDEGCDYLEHTEKVVVDTDGEPGGYLLLPGEACLGITEESIHLAPGLCGLLEGRSRFARLGLFVHITAGFMQPGINNRQVLEFFNASRSALLLKPGTK